jgi:hypothetical protein
MRSPANDTSHRAFPFPQLLPWERPPGRPLSSNKRHRTSNAGRFITQTFGLRLTAENINFKLQETKLTRGHSDGDGDETYENGQ